MIGLETVREDSGPGTHQCNQLQKRDPCAFGWMFNDVFKDGFLQNSAVTTVPWIIEIPVWGGDSSSVTKPGTSPIGQRRARLNPKKNPTQKNPKKWSCPDLVDSFLMLP
ncbi:MAG: hypothetical protein GY847_13370 [Proteobacteria bacterium]|nr:hypothetical protein [Pseudomonadota bacterium]